MEKRFAQGLSFLSSYTLSHAIDDGPGAGEGVTVVQNFRNRRAERASSVQDIRHRFVSSAIYDLPFGRGQRFLNRGGALGVLLSGWRLTGLASLHTGLPITPTLNVDPTNSLANYLAGARPNRLRDGNLPDGERTLQRAPFNFARFAGEVTVTLS